MNILERKIVVDIVNPYGGNKGGIEDVIRSWTQNLDKELFELRVMHMTPGIEYLEGYDKAYFLTEPKKFVDASYCASGYNLLINQLGSPDICIAATTPITTLACDKVRSFNKLTFPIFSWIHSEISKYEKTGNGGVRELLPADYHLTINSTIGEEIKDQDMNAKIYNIGNPIVHDIPIHSSNSSLGGKTLAYIGRLAEEKGIDIILEALYRAKSKWKLNIIGDGEIRPNVENWINTLKLSDRVKLLGWKSNPLPFMKDSIALVAASDYEGFMITGVESLAMGKMVICTPNQGTKDYIKPGINGYFFNFGDSKQLAQILDNLDNHSLPILDPQACMDSVSKYSKENYFSILKSILLRSVSEKKEPR
ncbi:glycosyltransferase [Butyrivibrio fibrisolvens]|uniref:glycosyltransferase n=1 Tax=Butyrivibrio fibrisolvens TaxID=831 RepID=UPI0003F8F115|nr:glycosyltransferase [Butyrivibrio fibrisolvens]